MRDSASQVKLPLSDAWFQRRIEFSDTDVAGIVHFSRFFVFMETAEHRFLNLLGSSVHTEIDGRRIGWPRVAASCDFTRPVRFEDTIDIHVMVLRKGEKSITYSVEFEHEGHEVAKGKISSVCAELTASGPRGIAIPDVIADRIEVYVP